MTYSAICCLLILGDDLSRIDRLGILANVRACQLSDGSFCAQPDGTENDARFVYCAASICYMLNDWRAFDVENAVNFIRNSLNFDGGIGQGPLLESHGLCVLLVTVLKPIQGGSTYCAVATLKLLGRLGSTFAPYQLERLKRWCLNRQEVGFHGRANKPDDSCYSFWIGATLKILGSLDLAALDSAASFTLSTQHNQIGGFGKYSDSLPDVLHTYLSLSGLSLLGSSSSLSLVDPVLNITERAISNLQKIRSCWPDLEISKLNNCCAES